VQSKDLGQLDEHRGASVDVLRQTRFNGHPHAHSRHCRGVLRVPIVLQMRGAMPVVTKTRINHQGHVQCQKKSTCHGVPGDAVLDLGMWLSVAVWGKAALVGQFAACQPLLADFRGDSL